MKKYIEIKNATIHNLKGDKWSKKRKIATLTANRKSFTNKTIYKRYYKPEF